MITNDSSKEYTKEMLKFVERKKRDRELQSQKQDETTKAFEILNNMISSTIVDNGLSDFIDINFENITVENKSPFGYQDESFDINLQHLIVSCRTIELAFYNKQNHIGGNEIYDFSFIVDPKDTSSNIYFTNNIDINTKYTPSLNEQHALYHEKKSGQWFLGIYKRDQKGVGEVREELTTDGVMRILYSAFHSVLR